MTTQRISVAYLAPWVDYGGSDKGTVDWFRWLDRDRFEALIITTQTSANRRLAEVVPYAREVWPLPELLPGNAFPYVIFDLLASRDVDVLHIMNSRLAFELLPDLAALPRPPRTVVQLHVEEEDRSGYVRYVITNYGNLVDAFSVTSRHLAEKVVAYGVPASRVHVIHTGVDAETEFAPGAVEPADAVRGGHLNVLVAGRFAAQKDPLLVVEVARALRARTDAFAIHMMGEGELETNVRRKVAEYGLRDHVLVHPATADVRPWYAACDALLLTSTFEGVPYVCYEAMAMGLPVVAASLPGTRELVDEASGTLVEPRGDVEAYAAALLSLTDSEARMQAGENARARMRAEYPIQRMAREHEQLYHDLTGDVDEGPEPRAVRGSRRNPARPLVVGEPIHLRARPIRGMPSVSIVIPCFNHGRYLRGCLDSIRGQSYPADRLQTIVVDDASSDPDTVTVLDELAAEEDVEVIRLERNRGPSGARNAGIERARGDFVLPVDADNLLMPEAVATLVNQLQNAGEQIGFVYPNLQFFGTRGDYFEAPAYNLALLAHGNYCDTCSLVDRWVFEAGIRYPEDYVLGHEDWDFALTLAERGVYGEPAGGPTLLYRKWGFTRSDVVEYSQEPFHNQLAARHPLLLDHGQRAVLNSRWNPALSVVALAEAEQAGEVRERLEARLAHQSLQDLEYVGFSATEFFRPLAPRLRRLSPALGTTAADRLFAGLETARGRWTLLVSDTASAALADPAFAEKLVRILQAEPLLDLVALVDDSRQPGSFSLRLVDPQRAATLEPHAVAAATDLLRKAADEPGVVADAPLASLLLRAITERGTVQWRHAPTAAPVPRAALDASWAARSWVRPRSRHELLEDRERWLLGPAYPGLPTGWVRRWTFWAGWMPPETLPLCRHRDLHTGEVVVTTDRIPPAGFTLEYDLGSIKRFASPGTVPLVSHEETFVIGMADDNGHSDLLGHLGAAHLPGFDAIHLAVDPTSGAHTLVGGDDQLAVQAERIGFLGYIEPYPIAPKDPPSAISTWGVVGVLRSVDRDARRHRYAMGRRPPGELVGELGAALARPLPGAIPLWLEARVATNRHRPPTDRPDLRQAARWVGAPLRWGNRSDPLGLARAVGRRALSAASLVRPSSDGIGRSAGRPDAYLLAEGGEGRRPLYSAVHPVTGDQLLTPFWLEANDMGYQNITLLGHLLEQAPVTGDLQLSRRVVPWANRFGVEARWV